ncbi:BTAD domain-containing putative transcriptional regulator [Micromonospora sp. CA-249363]|uniref:AfsR/SARP family transcriptional regulator n=1 Tax=Micromonospora sp. CA-249363 TaxID=3239963 RepID=UPI003D915513
MRDDLDSGRTAESASQGGPRLQIMGPLRVWRGAAEIDAGPRQQRRLLAVLLARQGRPTTTTDLMDLVWGPDSPASAVNVIHKYVAALRRLLEPDLPARAVGAYLLRHGNGYLFVAGPETLDLVAFRRDVSAAKSSLAQDRPEEALEHYLDALRRCHGSSGDGLVDSAAAGAVFAGLDGEFFDAAIAAAAVAVRLRQPARVLTPLRLAATMGQLNEPVHASLVTTLAAAGQQAEALTVYGVIRTRLDDELGIDPGYHLQDAHRRALTQTALTPAEEPDTVVARPVPLVRPTQLPPDPPLFVGRESELLILHDLATGMRTAERTSPLVIAMDGMGGVGTSTLATHFAHRVADEFADGQLYLDLRGHLCADERPSADDAVRSLLHLVGVPASAVPDTFDARIGTYRSMTAGKQMLFLLDNAHDAAQVRPLLPNSARSLVIVTSRRALVGLAAFDGAHLLRVDPPDLPTARRLLKRRLAGLPRSTDGKDCAGTADEIIELCGRLPLALAILAARIAARPGLSLTTIAAELRDSARRLEAFAGGRGLTDPRTAFSWSYRQLSPGAARLFRLLSVAPLPGITAEACVSLAEGDPDSTRAQLAELIDAALVSEHEDGRLTSHVLLKAYAEELLEADESAADRQAALIRLLQHYLHSSYQAQIALDPNRPPIEPPPPLPGVVAERPGTHDEAIAWFDRQREVLTEVVRLAADVGHGIVPWQLAISMQQYLQWAGRFQDWEDVMRIALRDARERGDVLGEAHALRSLAGAQYFLGAHEESLRLLDEAAQTYQDRGMRLEQALVHNNCHQVLSVLGRHERALEHSTEALSLFRLLDHRRGEISSLLRIGRSLTAQGKVAESILVLREALDLNQRVGRAHEESAIRAAVADNLAETGRIAEAVTELELAASTARRVGNRPSQFAALRQMADVLIAAGDVPGSRRVFEQARTLLRELPDGGTDDMRASVSQLAARLN